MFPSNFSAWAVLSGGHLLAMFMFIVRTEDRGHSCSRLGEAALPMALACCYGVNNCIVWKLHQQLLVDCQEIILVSFRNKSFDKVAFVDF